MLMPDVNVLVYAHREDEARHAAYARWLYYFPAIQTDGTGNLIAVFPGSSSATFAGVYASGQNVTTDPVNSFRAPVKPARTTARCSRPRSWTSCSVWAIPDWRLFGPAG